jgi:hypothetical protein
MKGLLRFFVIFVVALIASAYVHELGHSIAGWAQGVAVVPTPFKDYVLRDQIQWRQRIWISLGGVAGTMLLATGTLMWQTLKDRAHGDAILAGVFLLPFAYTLRFILIGRGHDGLEFQAAQSAIGANPSGHIVDISFLVLLIVGSAVWAVRKRATLKASSLVKIIALIVVGITLLVALQVVNNMLFDRFFPKTQTVGFPPGLQSKLRGGSQKQAKGVAGTFCSAPSICECPILEQQGLACAAF